MRNPSSPWFFTRVGVLILSGALVAPAQAPLGADVDIFGEAPEKKKAPDVVRPAANLLMGIFGAKRRVSSETKAPVVEGMEHLLIFQDGRQMRGKLVELTKDDVVWSRLDVNQPLRFGRKDVRRISLTGSSGEAVDAAAEQIFAQGVAKTAEKTSELTKRATLNLAGADWIHGDVSSEDGQTFSVKLSETASFTVPREKINWLYFSKSAVAGFGMSLANIDAWTISGGAVEDGKDGRLIFKSNYYVAKTMSPPKRFEVSFELPVSKQGDRGVSLWLQPFTPRPNSYSTGTVQLTFGEKEVERCIYDNGFKRDKAAIPGDAPAAVDGWHKLRIFYDGMDRKIAVMRNGKKIGEWALAEEQNAREVLRGLCFNKDGEDMRIGNFRLQPWDGDFTALENKVEGDRLAMHATPTKAGKLTAIRDKTLQFSGEEKETRSGTFVKLGEAGAGLADSDALLVFGGRGEVSVAGLELRDGRAKFRTGFSGDAEMDVKGLQTIAFPSNNGEQVAGDVLVFKNGDEFPGRLVETANGAALKWKTHSGFDVEIQPDRVAGVRFSVKPVPKTKPRNVSSGQPQKEPETKPEPEKKAPATVELRNGDRLAGELLDMAKDAVRFKNEIIGEREIPRAHLWSYFTAPVEDGQGRWMDVDPENRFGRGSTPDRWLTLDGAYVARPSDRNNSGEYAYLTRSGMKLPQRFEIRCDAKSIGSDEPYFGVQLASKNGSNQLNFSFSYGELNIHGYSQRNNGRSFSTEVPLRGKFADPSRRSIRLFVDSEKGTVAVMLDGTVVKKIGGKKDDTFTGLNGMISFSNYSGYSCTKLSNFWLGPWNGELPDFSKESDGSVSLTNGDVAAGKVLGVQDGKMSIGTDVGDFEMPMERIAGVEFGGKAAPAKTAGRLRLRDGTIVHVDEYRWQAEAISAKSAILGEIKVALADINELIISPPPLRMPASPEAAKPEEKPADAKPAEGEGAAQPVAAPAVKIEIVPAEK